MYKLSKRLKITAITLILIGAIGWVHSYKASHHLTLEDVEVMLSEEHSHHGNGASHNEDLNNKTDHLSHDKAYDHPNEVGYHNENHHNESSHHEEVNHHDNEHAEHCL